ncbi:MAG TPA: DUF393 domain-containing protein [Planctomycetes bacterium]|nr:DUF393 domain-containing protein [Planctomycetota bacterium]
MSQGQALRSAAPEKLNTEPWDVQVFFDGDCPLCVREIAMLRRLDRGRGRIRFTDIAAPSFDAGEHGLDGRDLMAEIHALLPSGEVITGVEVFRRLYAAVGFGGLTRLTRLPGLSQLLDVSYRVFARNRLRLTGRCDGGCAVQPKTSSQQNLS